MTNTTIKLLILTAMLILAASLAGCGGGDLLRSATFVVTVENVSPLYSSSESFDTPEGATDPSPIGPDEEYLFSFEASPGERLSLATMFVQSNDLFYAPLNGGIELFPGGNPLSGDITNQFELWDAGTEVNEEPGVGANQAPRQSGPNTGPDENGLVRLAANSGDGFTYPDNTDVLEVTITPTMSGNIYTFSLQIKNVSDAGTPYPLAPGVWVIHSELNPIFTPNEADRGEGLEEVAEDGDPTRLRERLRVHSGFGSPVAPGVWAVHTSDVQLYDYGQPDVGNGLEELAEDGDPSDLANHVGGLGSVLSAGVFDTPVGMTMAGPAGKGNAYQFSFQATEGERFSFATMMVQSNDLFFGFTNANGVDLFPVGTALSGDITSMISLWDAGTEVNERPGFGPNQAPRQSGPKMGQNENGPIRPITEVSDGFTYPGVANIIRVSITAVE